MKHRPEHVTLVDVAPRDGLQNEKLAIPTSTKLALIERLADAGLPAIEVTAFVSPKWVPQMADHDAIMRGLHPRRGVAFPVLVPNLQGFEAAQAAGAKEIAIFTAASEQFAQKNTNCSIRESLLRLEAVADAATAQGIRVRGYVSCIAGCPFEGEVAPGAVAEIAKALIDLGCYEVSLGDTIGVGTPASIRKVLEACLREIPAGQLAGHYHDTYGMAIANIVASLELGIATFDASVAGLGGCPYAPGASGNVATEDVVYLLHGLGINTGIDLRALAETGAWISGLLGRPSTSRAGRALLAKH